MPLCGHDTLKTRKTLSVNGKDYDYFSLEASGLGDISRLPYSLKVLLENLLRYEDGRSVSTDDAKAVVDWQKDRRSDREIAFRPARVLMQDFTGVPAVVDLAAMREAVVALGGDPKTINPLSPVDLVIDHSVMIDHFGAADSMKRNMDLEFERNGERYAFLRWGQKAFNNFRVVPPGSASAIRSIWNIWPRACGPAARAIAPWPIPIPWWERIRTPPWSMAWAFWAGASAASRPRRRCWASRSPCSSPRSSASS